MQKWVIVLATFTVLLTIGSKKISAQTTDPQFLYLGDVSIATAIGTGTRADPTTWNGTTGDWTVYSESNLGLIQNDSSHGTSSGITATDLGIPGVLQLSGSIGVWNVDIETGKGSPVLPSGQEDLSINNTTATGSGNLYIGYAQNGLTPANSSWIVTFGGTTVTASTTTVDGEAFEGAGAFSIANQLGTTLGPYSGSGAFSGATSGAGGGGSPYDLTELVQLTNVGAGNTTVTGDLSLAPAPEPSSIFLFGTGLLAFGGILRRRLLA